MRVTGSSIIARNLRELARIYPDKAAQALYAEAGIEMTEAKERTPWEFGVLKASGFVALPVRVGNQISVKLSFGGAAAGYAIYVHEDPDAYHPHGQWKFLESTLQESRPFMAARLAARLKLP